MPFIVTTKRPTDQGFSLSEEPVHIVSRVAAATLEGAQRAIDTAARTILGDCEPQGAWARWQEHGGGTVGPFPDGTTIEVEPGNWEWLATDAGLGETVLGHMAACGDLEAQAKILAAFNAREASHGS